MTRRRMHAFSICVLASLLVLLLCSRSVACEKVLEPLSLPSRRHTPSWDVSDADAAADEPRSSVFDGEADKKYGREIAWYETEGDSMTEGSTGQRRRLSWWGVVLYFAHQCPPGPLGHHCHDSSGSSSSGSGGSGSSGGSNGGSNGGGGSSGSGSNGGGGSSGSGSNGGDSSGGDGSGGDGSGSGGTANGAEGWSDDWGGGGGTSASDSSTGSTSAFLSAGSKGFWVLLVAAAAIATAIAAMIVGSRRTEKKEHHHLRGVIAQRMKLFGGLTDRCFADRSFCGGALNIEGDSFGATEMGTVSKDQDQAPAGYRSVV